MKKGVQKEYKSVRKSVRKCTKCTYESVHWNTNRNDYQDRQGVVKSKLFRGIISNMEIIHTRSTSIPEELLDFILSLE